MGVTRCWVYDIDNYYFSILSQISKKSIPGKELCVQPRPSVVSQFCSVVFLETSNTDSVRAHLTPVSMQKSALKDHHVMEFSFWKEYKKTHSVEFVFAVEWEALEFEPIMNLIIQLFENRYHKPTKKALQGIHGYMTRVMPEPGKNIEYNQIMATDKPQLNSALTPNPCQTYSKCLMTPL